MRSSFKRFSENRVRRRRLWLLPVLFLLVGLSFWGIKTFWTSESATAGGGQKEKSVSAVSITATVPAKGGEVWVKVVKSSHTLYLYEGDRIIMTSTVALGENPETNREPAIAGRLRESLSSSKFKIRATGSMTSGTALWKGLMDRGSYG